MSHTHIKIWNNKIPFNTGEDKYKDLIPFDNNVSYYESLGGVLAPSLRRNDMVYINNIIRQGQIPMGRVKDTYSDEPYIVPFIVKGSKESILLVPGGGYFDVSMDGEGYPGAEALNKLGYTVFVLKYRTYPYKYPVPQLDCRRALCYLKANCDQFGIDPNKISLIGFSAGGNLVLSTVLLFKDMPLIEGYEKDDIDKLDPTPVTLSPIYALAVPERQFTASQFGERVCVDDKYWEELQKTMYLPQYINENTPPMFIMNCIDDPIVEKKNTLEIIKHACEKNIKYEAHMFLEGGHGFGFNKEDVPAMYGNPAYDMRGTREWCNLYVAFIQRILKERTNGN